MSSPASPTSPTTTWTHACRPRWTAARSEGTPRPETNAGPRARPGGVLGLRGSVGEDVPQRRARPRDQGAVPGLHLPHGDLRVLRQPALRQGQLSRAWSRDAVRRPAQLRVVRQFDDRQKAALAYAQAIAWNEDDRDGLWARLHAHFTESELVELGCVDRPDLRPAELDPAARRRPPPVLAGTSASMAPGFEDAEALAASKARRTTGPRASPHRAPRSPPVSAAARDPLAPVLVEPLVGSTGRPTTCWPRPSTASTSPYALRLPDGPGPHPFVLVAYGNGGGGLGWLQDRVHRFRHVTDVLLEAGYACAWVRYRTEVELGYQSGGPLRSDGAPGHGADEPRAAGVRGRGRDPAPRRRPPGDRRRPALPRRRQPRRRDALQAAVALLRPAARRRRRRAGLARAAHPAPRRRSRPSTSDGGLRDIESMEIRSTERARARIADPDEVSARLDGVDIPVLVLGRDEDELQGIFRLTYELLAEKRDDAEWRTVDATTCTATSTPSPTPTAWPGSTTSSARRSRVIVDFLDRHRRRDHDRAAREERGMYDDIERVGFVGLGAMGSGIARRLMDAGHTVVGWNRTRSKAQDLLDAGMGWADTPREVAEQCDVVFTMLTNTAAIEGAAHGDDGLLAGTRRRQGVGRPEHHRPRAERRAVRRGGRHRAPATSTPRSPARRRRWPRARCR